MENRKLTKVMWLEEDLFEAENFIEDALNYDLEVVRFTCWEDAKNSITENPKKWEAIVLDPKCKLLVTNNLPPLIQLLPGVLPVTHFYHIP